MLILLLVGVAMHAQRNQKNKFVIFQQYSKKEVRDKLDFLYEDKHQSFLQADTVFFGDHS